MWHCQRDMQSAVDYVAARVRKAPSIKEDWVAIS